MESIIFPECNISVTEAKEWNHMDSIKQEQNDYTSKNDYCLENIVKCEVNLVEIAQNPFSDSEDCINQESDYITLDDFKKEKREFKRDETAKIKAKQKLGNPKMQTIIKKPKFECIDYSTQHSSSATGDRFFIKCKICNKKYAANNRIDHMIKHDNPRPYECFDCKKVFQKNYQLRNHQKTHLKEKDFICELCGNGFSYPIDLKRHMRRHSENRPYKCALCSKCYKSPSSLNAHFQLHANPTPFPCQFCEKSFTTPMGKRLHERQHTGEKPYACTYCDSRFSDNSTMKQHVRTHTGERPYKCHLCGKGTTTASNLKSHYRTNHQMKVTNVTSVTSSRT